VQISVFFWRDKQNNASTSKPGSGKGENLGGKEEEGTHEEEEEEEEEEEPEGKSKKRKRKEEKKAGPKLKKLKEKGKEKEKEQKEVIRMLALQLKNKDFSLNDLVEEIKKVDISRYMENTKYEVLITFLVIVRDYDESSLAFQTNFQKEELTTDKFAYLLKPGKVYRYRKKVNQRLITLEYTIPKNLEVYLQFPGV